jgi:PAS domain S-box-containing protein
VTDSKAPSEAEVLRGLGGELNRHIIDALPGGFVHIGANGAILAANCEAIRVLGLEYEPANKQFHRRFRRKVVHEDGTPCPESDYAVSLALATGQPQGPMTLGLYHDDGRVIWAMFSAVPLHAASGEISGALVAMLDITARREADAALRRSEELLRSIIQSAPNPIATTDREGHLLFVTNAPPGGQGQELAWARLVPEDHAGAKQMFEHVLATGERQIGEATGESGIRWRMHAGPRYEGDQIAGVTFVAWDVTEQKQLETRLAIADRMASIGTLSAAVAHEVNNPLTYVLANLEWAAKKSLERGDTAMAERLGAALEGIARIRSVVSDVGTFSRVEEDRQHLLDVRALLEMGLRIADMEIRHRARLIREYREVPPVLGSEGRLGQVFLNLLVNAAQAIPEGQADENEIRVSTSTDTMGNVVVEVSDTGAGIPPSLLERVFDPFVTTKPRGVGTGLGLYICKNIVTSLGGELSVTSTPGKGSAFRVVLPASPGASLNAVESNDPPRSVRRLRVLVADDEAAIGKALSMYLEGHEVDIVNSGRAAIERLETEEYDALFCDLVMPDLTGMDVFDWVQANRPKMLERLIFMTGGGFTPRARQFLETVENEVLEKPFTHVDIERAVTHRRG